MAKCKTGKCSCRARITSNVVANMPKGCFDVCTNPICASPIVLSILAPLIYDEIGINLCTTFELDEDLSADYPTVTNATIQIVDIAYEYGDEGIEIEQIPGRPNCYEIDLRNLNITFAINLFDDNCRLLATLYRTELYLPPEDCETFNEDTNPSSVELELFAPYGLAFNTEGQNPQPIISTIGFSLEDNFVRQGINLYAIPKLINLDVDDDDVTVGVTIVLQSLYFAGYQVASEGKINTPKGSIIPTEDTECMKFVEGELLNLAIKPLNLGSPECEEKLKRDCTTTHCGNNCNSTSGTNAIGNSNNMGGNNTIGSSNSCNHIDNIIGSILD